MQAIYYIIIQVHQKYFRNIKLYTIYCRVWYGKAVRVKVGLWYDYGMAWYGMV